VDMQTKWVGMNFTPRGHWHFPQEQSCPQGGV
jgi:hypothetical protein